MRFFLFSGAAVVALLPHVASAQGLPVASDTHTSDKQTSAATSSDEVGQVPGQTESGTSTDNSIVVTAQKLNAARASIQPSLGATSYSIANDTIKALPGGDNQQLNQIILQLPGVVQDGFGQFHVRDDHNNLQYRINGTILPEGVAVFGQTLSPRLIDSFNLLTGALPAQYGLRTAGIIDITTKSGFDNGGQVSLYGGSHGTIEPSLEYGGSTGSTDYFVSGDFKHDNLGIESVDGSSNPLHDETDQAQLFTYVDHILDPDNKVSFVGGYSNQYFQIPNPRGLHAATEGPGYSVNGQSDFLSDNLNERQLEKTGFGQFALLHDAGDWTIQASLLARYSSVRYRPDVLGELLFNGLAQAAYKQDFTAGAQVDAVYRASSSHTLRGGVLITRDRSNSQTTTHVFPVDYAGNQTGEPFVIDDNTSATEWTESVYLQDEWKIAQSVTLNFGGRYDHYCGYRCEDQFSPRANIVWQPTESTTIHAGYARYFSPAPFENVGTSTIAKFDGTSAAAPAGALNTVPYAERQNYFDVGIQQQVGGGLTVGIDAYHRRSTNLIDEGQFGAPIILTPFNYQYGRIDGVEGNISYQSGPWLAYGNFAYAKAQGKNIISSQFAFNPADLAYIQNHYIYLDHDQTYTASAGVSYAFRRGMLYGLKLGGDMIYGSGLRTDGAVPNGGKLSPYAQFNLSASYHLAGPGIGIRFDVVNLFDHVYEIRDGSGVGVGAPQYGPRRGFFVGITKDL